LKRFQENIFVFEGNTNFPRCSVLNVVQAPSHVWACCGYGSFSRGEEKLPSDGTTYRGSVQESRKSVCGIIRNDLS